MPQNFSRGTSSGRQNWASADNWNRGTRSNLGAWNRGTWNGSNWNRGTWAANNWNRGYWNPGWRGRDWDDQNGWWWAVAPLLGGYWNNWYPGYWGGTYNYYSYPAYYYGYPAYDYGYPTDYSYDYGYDYAQPADVAPEPSYPAYEDQPALSEPQPAVGADQQYLDEAVTAFQSGNYQEAERLAAHALVDNPRDATALELISLSAMGLGDYRAAAAEAHGVASLNGVPSWSEIYNFYGDLGRFTSQLRSLETFVTEHPTNAPAQFLLGSLYLSMGHRPEAEAHLSEVVALTPKDQVAQQLLSEAGGQVPATAAPSSALETYNAPNDNPTSPAAASTADAAPPSSPPVPAPVGRSLSNSPSNVPATAAASSGLRYY